MKKIILIIIAVIICAGGITIVVINNKEKESSVENVTISESNNVNASNVLEDYIKNMKEGNTDYLVEMINLEKLNEIFDTNWEKEKVRDTYKEFFSNVLSYNVKNKSEITNKSELEEILNENIGSQDLENNITNSLGNGCKVFEIDVNLLDKNNTNKDIKDIIIVDKNDNIIYTQILVLMNLSYNKVNNNKVNSEKLEIVTETVTPIEKNQQ